MLATEPKTPIKLMTDSKVICIPPRKIFPARGYKAYSLAGYQATVQSFRFPHEVL